MAKFLSCGELYETIQQKSSEAKELLWVCSPYLGLDAHAVFSQEILKRPPADMRFVFRISDLAVKEGKINPYELQFITEHFGENTIRSNGGFNSRIYIFDNSALITSASLQKEDFEINPEAGVLLEGSEFDAAKAFFSNSLWEKSKPIKDLAKYKKLWNMRKKSQTTTKPTKAKAHTKIKSWTDEYVARWYFAVPVSVSKKTQRKIKKETGWATTLSVVSDIGPGFFKQIKLGDLAFLANLNKRRGKIEIELALIIDKSKVETDEGDLHFAYEPSKAYLVERNRFYAMLKTAALNPKGWGTLLNEDQVRLLTETLSKKRSRKSVRS